MFMGDRSIPVVRSEAPGTLGPMRCFLLVTMLLSACLGTEHIPEPCVCREREEPVTMTPRRGVEIFAQYKHDDRCDGREMLCTRNHEGLRVSVLCADGGCFQHTELTTDEQGYASAPLL